MNFLYTLVILYGLFWYLVPNFMFIFTIIAAFIIVTTEGNDV